MGNIGPWEIALIVLAVLLIFGPKRLPGIGRSLGRGMRDFKESVGDTAKEIKDAAGDTPSALREGLDAKQQLKQALNPFAEDEQDGKDEPLEGDVVGTPASSSAAVAAEPIAAAEPEPVQPEPEPVADAEPEPASAERA